MWVYCFSSSLWILFPRPWLFAQVDDICSNIGSSLCREGWKSPPFSPALCPVNPSLHRACKQMLPIVDRVTALEGGEISTEFILQSSVAQFFSRILVRSSFSLFTIGLGSSFSPAAIMAFS